MRSGGGGGGARGRGRSRVGDGGGGYGRPHLYADEEGGEMGADIAEEEGI